MTRVFRDLPSRDKPEEFYRVLPLWRLSIFRDRNPILGHLDKPNAPVCNFRSE